MAYFEHPTTSTHSTATTENYPKKEAAARTFQPPSDIQGFQHVYVPTRARIPVGQLRSKLRKLNTNNSRILDVHYRDKHVVAFVIHNDYAEEFKQALTKFKINTIKYNPCDPNNLRDPQYKDLTIGTEPT